MSDSGDYTYEPLTGLARMQARIAELEQSCEFWRTAALDWKQRWEAVPVTSILALYDGLPAQDDAKLIAHLDAIGDWLCDVCPPDDEVQP